MPAWIDMLRHEYRRDAAGDIAWREPTYGAWCNGELTPAARLHLGELVRARFGADMSVIRRDLVHVVM